MPITGTTIKIKAALTNPATGEPADAPAETLTLKVVDPTGSQVTYNQGEITNEGTGLYRKEIVANVTGLWHYRWLVNDEAADEGEFTMESEFTEGEEPDLTDLRVLVPRARRKVEGPWGNSNNRPPLSDTQVYEMVADACADLVMLSGSFFHQTLEVKARDPLGGFPTEWKTSTAMEEYEVSIVCAQLALNYYYFLFRNMKISESIKNEGTEWAYALSANVIKNYLESLKDERDKAIAGLRLNIPVLDRFASTILVRDRATVAVLEWWRGEYDTVSGGGLPGGQEATNIPWFPGPEGGP
jgi:hypothetical protein